MSLMGPRELGRLIDVHAAALVLYARQWCACPEDVVQEAFVKLTSRPSPPEPVLPWLYRVVRNGALTARRAAERRRKHETQAAARQPTWFVAAEPGCHLLPGRPGCGTGALAVAGEQCRFDHCRRLPRLAVVAPAEAAAGDTGACRLCREDRSSAHQPG